MTSRGELMSRRARWTAPLVAVLLLGTVSSQDTAISAGIVSRIIDSPAGDATAEPNLTRGGDGLLYLSWIGESEVGEHELYYSRRDSSTWSSPVRIASGETWFVNWADFPAIATIDGQVMLASWLEKTGLGTYAYGVRMSLSGDGGKGWEAPFFVHRDSTPTEHGFVSLTTVAENRFMAVWLDGRETVNENSAMTLRAAVVGSDGELREESLLDPRVCDCCQTSAATTGDGSIVVVYRDRGDDETRDISITRFTDDVWTTPTTVHPDGWKIAGCPVNGPAVAARDSIVAVAWFTVGSQEVPVVNVAFSRDHGQTFAPPMRVDNGDPLGRVDIVFSDDSSVVVCWIENGDQDSHLMIRRACLDEYMSRPVAVTSISPERESGFPHLGANDEEVILTWTDTGHQKGVKTALITAD